MEYMQYTKPSSAYQTVAIYFNGEVLTKCRSAALWEARAVADGIVDQNSDGGDVIAVLVVNKDGGVLEGELLAVF